MDVDEKEIRLLSRQVLELVRQRPQHPPPCQPVLRDQLLAQQMGRDAINTRLLQNGRGPSQIDWK